MQENILREIRNSKVEWKELGEIASYEQPTKYLVKSTKYKDEFKIPVLTAGKTFILGFTDEEEGIYPASENPVIIFDDFTTANKWVDFDFKAKSSAMKILSSKNEKEVLLKYIYYFLNTLPSETSESDHKRQWISTFSKKKIPLPSLELQNKIVEILDKFTLLLSELKKELQLRKKQYEFYREKLLSFGDEVEWKELGDKDLFEVSSGGTPSKAKSEYWENGKIPWLKSESCKNEEIFSANHFINDLALKNSSAKLLSKNTTLIALVGTTIFKTAFTNFQTTTNQNIGAIKSKNENIVNDKFIFYFLTNLYNKLKAEMRTYGMLNLTNLKEFKIPIPSIKKQQEIVFILDKFETLTNSISEGLPKEIELRQKQYEYYRNLLLTFEE